MIPVPRRRRLALALMHFRATHRVSIQGLAAWLDVPVGDLPAVGAYPCPDRDSPTLAAECAAIARASGADPRALRQVVAASDWAAVLAEPPIDGVPLARPAAA